MKKKINSRTQYKKVKKRQKKINVIKQKRIKIRFGRLFLTLLIFFFIGYLIFTFLKFPIKNIFISGNNYLTDQQIIDMAKISNYPSIFKYSEKEIEKKLEKSFYVKNATVKKKNFSAIYIKIEENRALFYNKSKKKTVLLNKKEVKQTYNVPILINYVPDTVYLKFVTKMGLINESILNRISEIKYEPSNVDDERFLLIMSDGNYVYINLDKFESINNYVEISLEIVNKFGNKKGVLNLDAGEYFEIFK